MTEYEEELLGEIKARLAEHVMTDQIEVIADDILDLIRSEGLLDGRK